MMKAELTHKIPGVYTHFKGDTYIAVAIATHGVITNQEPVVAHFSEDPTILAQIQIDEDSDGAWIYDFGQYTNEDLGLNPDALMVVYVSVSHSPKVWVREMTNFMSPVDTDKYPDTNQEFRFKYIGDQIY